MSAGHATRIAPIVGAALAGRRIAVLGSSAAWAAGLLESCGARGWRAGDPRPDALVADAAAASPSEIARAAAALDCPAAVACWPRAGWASGHAWLCRPGDPPAALPAAAAPADELARLELGAVLADLLRAWFTAGTPYAPAGWCERLAEGRTLVSLGAPEWPWQVAWDSPERFAARAQSAGLFEDCPARGCARDETLASWPVEERSFLSGRAGQTPAYLGGAGRPRPHVLVIGLGSLGSWAVHALRRAAGRFTLVDPDSVEDVNLARQWYAPGEVGRAKAAALAARLRVPAAAYVLKLDGAACADLVARCRPDVAILATATDGDFGVARALYAAGVPHVVGRCYPRGRYAEAVVVTPGGPCLGCLRGHLYTGAAPPPAPEERAAYGLAAETRTQPATRLEVGRAALLLARAALALAAPVAPAWLAARRADGRACLLLGNVCEGAAYGLRAPLQVAAYGLPDIVGTQAEDVCADCGRANAVAHRV